jgi:putative copper export protein
MYSPVDDPKKMRLQRKAAAQREELETEFEELTERTEKILTNALIIGGALALTYILVRQLAGGKSRKKQKAKEADATKETEQAETESPLNNILTQVGTVLATQATVFLLSLAKEKLTAYLRDSANAKTDEHS